MAGQKVIKVFNHEEKVKSEFSQLNNELQQSATKAHTLGGILMPINMNLGNLTYLMVGVVGGCLAVGLQWRASRRGIDIRNLEVSLQAQADNILVFLGIEDSGHPGLRGIEGSLYVETEAEDDVLQALWEETLLRSPVTQSLVRQVPVHIPIKRA